MTKMTKEENRKLTENARRKEFLEEYAKLCERFGLEVFGFPKWLRDEKGAWITLIQYGVDKYTKPKEEKKVEIAK